MPFSCTPDDILIEIFSILVHLKEDRYKYKSRYSTSDATVLHIIKHATRGAVRIRILDIHE